MGVPGFIIIQYEVILHLQTISDKPATWHFIRKDFELFLKNVQLLKIHITLRRCIFEIKANKQNKINQ